MNAKYQTEEKWEKADLEAKEYRLVGLQIKKLLTATGAAYIPKLCKALKRSWYPNRSYEEIADNPDVQSEVIQKVLDEWSYQRNDNETPWSDFTIHHFLPEWLLSEKGRAVREGKIYKRFKDFIISAEEQLTKLDRIADVLPDPPEGEQKPEADTLGGHEPKALGTPFELYGDAMDAIAKLWLSLANHKDLPPDNRDRTHEIIDDSRKFRLRLLKGLNDDDRTGLLNKIVLTSLLLNETIKMGKDLVAGQQVTK